jgi:hypothetical protein
MKPIVKPSTSWLTTDSDPLLINDASVVLSGTGANVNIYKSPSPPLADVQTALDNFSDGVTAAADRSKSAIAKRNNLRLILTGLLRQLANYVASACNGDMTNLLLSGFPIQKPTRQPVGVLPPPNNVTLTQGDRSGEVMAKAGAVFGASLYTWTLTPATPGAAATTVQTTAARNTFTGLTPGATYSITVNAIGTAGASDWSNPASLMVV